LTGIQHWNGSWRRRAIVITAGVLLLIQTFSAAYATVAAVGAGSVAPEPAAAPCHDSAEPTHAGHSGGDGTHKTLPCALCFMTVGGLILPAVTHVADAATFVVRIVAYERPVFRPALPRARAGQSQAPPAIA
jgi:hypothetical protein